MAQRHKVERHVNRAVTYLVSAIDELKHVTGGESDVFVVSEKAANGLEKVMVALCDALRKWEEQRDNESA